MTPLYATALQNLRNEPGCAVFAAIMLDSGFDFIAASSTCSMSSCAAVLLRTAQAFEDTVAAGQACTDDIIVLSFLTNMCTAAEDKPFDELCTVPILAAELLYALRADYTVSQVLQPDVDLQTEPTIIAGATNLVITRELLNIACDSSCVSPLVRTFRSLAGLHETYRLKADMFLFLCSKSPTDRSQYCMVEQDAQQGTSGPPAIIQIPNPQSSSAGTRTVEHPNPELLAFEMFSAFPGQAQRMCTHCAHFRMQSFMQAFEIVAITHIDETRSLLRFVQAELTTEHSSQAAQAASFVEALQQTWTSVSFALDTQTSIVIDVILAAVQSLTDMIRFFATTLAAQSLDDLVCKDPDSGGIANRPRCVDAWGVFNHLNVKLWSYSPYTMLKRCSQPSLFPECVRYAPNVGQGALQDTCEDCCHAQSLHWLARAQFLLGQVLLEPGVFTLVHDVCAVVEQVAAAPLLSSLYDSQIGMLSAFCVDALQEVAEAAHEAGSVSAGVLAAPGMLDAQRSCLRDSERPAACEERATCSAEFELGEGMDIVSRSDALHEELVAALVIDIRFATGLPTDQMDIRLINDQLSDRGALTLLSITLQSFVQATCKKRIAFIVDVVGSVNGVHLFETQRTLRRWEDAGWWQPASGSTDISLRAVNRANSLPVESSGKSASFPVLPVTGAAGGLLLAVLAAAWYAKSVKKKRVMVQP